MFIYGDSCLSDVYLPEGFSVKEIAPTDIDKKQILDDIGELQYQVWKNSGMNMSSVANDVMDNIWLDKFDKNAYIWAIYKEKQLVASARLTIHDSIPSLPDAYCYTEYEACFPSPIAAFNRLVVLKEFRQLKLSHYLELIRIKKSIELGAKSITLMCPDYRIDSLMKKKFSVLGNIADDPHYPNIKWVLMRRML